MIALTPESCAAPLAAYSHGVLARPARFLATSGQLPLAVDGTVPDGVEAQATLCFENISRILAEAGMTTASVMRINAYVTDRGHMQGYMAARDKWVSGAPVLPASTLMIVSGFTRPEFLVEIEVFAIEEKEDAAKTSLA